MNKVATFKKYEFFVGWDENCVPYYNILLAGSQIPTAGYYSADYICKVKNVPNLFY